MTSFFFSVLTLRIKHTINNDKTIITYLISLRVDMLISLTAFIRYTSGL